MKIKIRKKENCSRKDLANPHRNVPHRTKLKKAKAINLKDNHTIEDLGGGYCRIKPVDLNKRF